MLKHLNFIRSPIIFLPYFLLHDQKSYGFDETFEFPSEIQDIITDCNNNNASKMKYE